MMKLFPIDDRHYTPSPVYASAIDADVNKPDLTHTRVWGDGEVVLTFRIDGERLIGIDPGLARAATAAAFVESYGCQLKCSPEFHAELKRWYAAEFKSGRDHANGRNLIPGELMTMASGWNETFVRATFDALTNVICDYEHWNFDRLLGLAAS